MRTLLAHMYSFKNRTFTPIF